jgi:hypothetical protein
MILEVGLSASPIITHRRWPTVACVCDDTLGKARVKHGKHGGSNKVNWDNIYIVLFKFSLRLGTDIVLVDSFFPQCMGTICKTLMKIAARTTIPMGGSLVHQIFSVFSCRFQCLLTTPLTAFLVMLNEAHPYLSWGTNIIQVPLIVAVHMVELVWRMLFALHDQILECTDAAMLSHSNYSFVV